MDVVTTLQLTGDAGEGSGVVSSWCPGMRAVKENREATAQQNTDFYLTEPGDVSGSSMKWRRLFLKYLFAWSFSRFPCRRTQTLETSQQPLQMFVGCSCHERRSWTQNEQRSSLEAETDTPEQVNDRTNIWTLMRALLHKGGDPCTSLRVSQRRTSTFGSRNWGVCQYVSNHLFMCKLYLFISIIFVFMIIQNVLYESQSRLTYTQIGMNRFSLHKYGFTVVSQMSFSYFHLLFKNE